MSKKLKLTVRDGGDGKLAIINGKTYSLLRLYRHGRLDGIFCLSVAGHTPLKADDLDANWRVFRSGNVYLALDCRPFSYHLIEGDGSPTDVPRWPRLKTPAVYYAFVGPNEQAVQAQIKLALERYHSKAVPETLIASALKVQDECGGPPAYLLKSERL